MDNRYKQLLSNTGVFAVAKISAKIIVVLLLPLYTNILTKEEFGITELAVTYANFIVPIISFSIQEAVFRFGLDKDSNKSDILSSAIIFALAAALLVAILAPLATSFLDIEGYEIYFVAFLLSLMFRQIFSLFLKACNKNALFAVDTVVYSLSLAISNIMLLCFVGMRADGYLLALISANVISIIFCGTAGRAFNFLKLKSFNYELLKNMLIYSTPLILNQVSWWISNSSDKLFLSKLDSVASVGLYSAAGKIPAIISNLVSVFIQALVISAIAEYRTEKGRAFFERVFQVFHVFSIGSVLLLFLLNSLLTKIMLGEEFQDAWIYQPQLLLASLYLGYAYFFGTLYTAEKKNVPAMISTIIAAICNIALDILCIPIWGITGACLATIVSHGLLAVYRLWDTRKILAFSISPVKTIISNILIIITGFIMIYNSSLTNYIIITSIVITLVLYRTQIMNIIKRKI